MYSTHIAAFTVLREQHPNPSLTDKQLSMHLFEINVLFAAFLTQIGIQQVMRLFVEIRGKELVKIQQLLYINRGFYGTGMLPNKGMGAFQLFLLYA